MVDKKQYLDYLDKEMTIMGVLSAFSAGVLAILADKMIVGQANNPCTMWNNCAGCQKYLIIAAYTGFLLATYFFYKQRSKLAQYHGDISWLIAINISDTIKNGSTSGEFENFPKNEDEREVNIDNKINKTHRWSFWLRLDFAMFCIAYAVINLIILSLNWVPDCCFAIPLIIALLFIIVFIIHACVYCSNNTKERPYGHVFKKIICRL